jgi:hypothetical protein
MQVAKWCLWYDDGRRVEGTTFDEWCAAPTEAVIYAMVFFDDGTAAHLTGYDLVWLKDFGDGLVAASDNDREGMLRRLPWVKWGRWTTNEKYLKVQQEAVVMADGWHQERTGSESLLGGEYKGCCPEN